MSRNLIIFAMSAVTLFADPSAQGSDSVVVPADTSFQRFAGVPALAYTGETGLQYGVLGIVFFKPDSGVEYGDQLDVALMHTTKGQTRLVATPVNWLMRGRLRLENEVNYYDWPGLYMGMGNTIDTLAEPYDMSMFWWNGNAQAEPSAWLELPWWLQKSRVGIEYDFEVNKTQFDSAEIGNTLKLGGRRIGLGWNILWDTRDHDNGPRNGSFVWWRQVYFNQLIGSQWDFINSKLDVRTYFPLPREGALALGSYWEGVLGSVPFDRLSMPDGTYHMRGLDKGSLRDRQQWVLQSEVRMPLVWRLGAVAFAEAGKVGPHFGALLQEDFHYVLGFGGRFAMNRSRKVNIRADLSWIDGDMGLTLYYKESF